MFSHNLEASLNVAFNFAKENRHEFMTVEHLLLALCDNPEVLTIFTHYKVNVNKLRKSLKEYMNVETPKCQLHNHLEIQPTLGFQRVLQRAIFQVQAMAKTEVSGVNTLAAIFNEQESQAVFLLTREGLSRKDVIDFDDDFEEIQDMNQETKIDAMSDEELEDETV